MIDEKPTKMVPIRYVAMIWILLCFIFIFPDGVFSSLMKLIAAFLVVLIILSSWKDTWVLKGYETLGAFVTQNTVFFALILFFNLPEWIDIALIFWIIVGFSAKFSQIDDVRTKSNKHSKYKTKEAKLLNQYLGQTSYLVDKRKMSLIDDQIDLKQWKKNMDYIFSNIDPTRSPEYASLLEEKKAKLLRNVTPDVRNVLMGLSMYMPSMLDVNEHSWFIAAYPDVLNFFYPSVNYGKNYKNEKKRVDNERLIVDPLKEKFEKFFEEKYRIEIEKGGLDISIFLLELKDFYMKETGKLYLLSNKPEN